MQDTSSPDYYYGQRQLEKCKMNARQQNGMHLFISLVKDGCEWQGDVMSNKWSECLFFDPSDTYIAERVKRTLSAYTNGDDYRWEGDNAIWIA